VSGGFARPPLRAAWLEIAAAAGMLGFGLVMALLGAILPLLSQRLGIELAAAGNLFLAMNAAMLAITVVIGPVVDRFGARPALIAAPLASAAAVCLVALAGGFAELLLAGVLLGLGGGVLNAATNVLVADLHDDPHEKSAALNRLGLFFGVGAVLVPFSVGVLLQQLGLKTILLAAAGVSALPAAFALALRFPAPKQSGGLPLKAMAGLVRNPLVVAFALLLFCQSGNEFVLSGYLATFLTREVGLSMQQASYLLAGYWIAVMTSRVALSRLLLIWEGRSVVQFSAAGVAVLIVLLAQAHSPEAAALGVLALGLAISPIFPTTLGLAGGRFAELSGSVFGFIISVALCGGMTEPWIVGHLGQAAGLRAALLVPAGAAVCILFLQTLIRRMLSASPAA
jgi:MFS transporter, FHS family, glucose/mannose:H+ symporter